MQIKVNGEAREIDTGLSLQALLKSLSIEAKNLAIEHNGAFIEDDADLGAIALAEGDSLEIVRFVGGG
jgi:thiamine biosynthesis protein ThiS